MYFLQSVYVHVIYLISLLQMVMPKFPVIVKIGHAFAGMGKVGCMIYTRWFLISEPL